MNKFEELALITFIALDVVVENPNNIKLLCGIYLDNIKLETKDVIKRLLK